MKMIVAIIRPSKLDQVRASLTEIGIQGMTCSEVSGFGRQKGHTEIYRGAEYQVSFVPRIKVEIAVEDSMAYNAVDAIRQAANTEKIGDGKIFVFDLGEALRIRTGETGSSAL